MSRIRKRALAIATSIKESAIDNKDFHSYETGLDTSTLALFVYYSLIGVSSHDVAEVIDELRALKLSDSFSLSCEVDRAIEEDINNTKP